MVSLLQATCTGTLWHAPPRSAGRGVRVFLSFADIWHDTLGGKGG